MDGWRDGGREGREREREREKQGEGGRRSEGEGEGEGKRRGEEGRGEGVTSSSLLDAWMLRRLSNIFSSTVPLAMKWEMMVSLV